MRLRHRTIVCGGQLCKYGVCFLASEADDVGNRVFVGKRIFGNVRGVDFKRKAGLREKFSTAGRGGCENEAVHICSRVLPRVEAK